MSDSLNPHQLATLVRWLTDAHADSSYLWNALAARAAELSSSDAAAALQTYALSPDPQHNILGALEKAVVEGRGTLSSVTLAGMLKACSKVGSLGTRRL